MRKWVCAALSALLLAAIPARAAEQRMDVNGLHNEDWFTQSLLILDEDFADVAASGKRLAIVWEQKGCPYCREMHDVHLRDPKIAGYIRDRFAVVQLDLRGDRQVTDFDGETLTEKELARKWRVTATPTVQFLPADPAVLKGRKGPPAEVARMPGLLKPDQFLAMFEYAHDQAYVTQPDFQTYLKTRIRPGR